MNTTIKKPAYEVDIAVMLDYCGNAVSIVVNRYSRLLAKWVPIVYVDPMFLDESFHVNWWESRGRKVMVTYALAESNVDKGAEGQCAGKGEVSTQRERIHALSPGGTGIYTEVKSLGLQMPGTERQASVKGKPRANGIKQANTRRAPYARKARGTTKRQAVLAGRQQTGT